MMKRIAAALLTCGLLASVAFGQAVPNAGSPMVPNAAPGTGGGGAVSSVFGRTGAVAAQSGDYSFGLISGQAALAQLPTLGANTVLGSIAGGTPIALSNTQLTTLINPATASLPGALPAWPSNTTTFFRGDGTYVTLNCAALAGVGTGCGNSAANPTATAGPAAVNGAATTYMRSDAAPAVQLGTNAQKGVVQVDGTTITATAGVIAAANTGTVSSIATSCGVTGGAITTTGTIKAIATPNAQTGTSYAILDADCGKYITLSNAAAVAVSIAQAGTAGSFASGWFVTLSNQGAGLVTLTPATSTINGAATLTLKQFQSIDLWTDGTNYFAATGRPTSVACADLTNGGTACTAATGTSGHTLPFLDGANTFSGTQTFGNVFGTVSTQSGTTYTLASTDCGTEVAFTNAAAVTVTIPAALTTGCNIAILQTTAAGQVTVTGTAVSAATLHSGHSYTKTFGQWSIIGINIYTTGVAILTGDGA